MSTAICSRFELRARRVRHLVGSLRTLAVAAAVAVSFAVPDVSSAQSEGDGYLFGTPRGSLSVRAGFAKANAASKVFEHSSTFFTLDRGDYSSPSLSIDAGVMFGNRVEAQFGVGFAGRTVGSNYRDLVDNNDQEIEQSTQFRRVPITFGLRVYLVPPGRSLGKFAWVPSRVSPYLAAGAGGVFYRFKQSGDFVDFEDGNAVFNNEVESSGWAPTAYGAAGITWSLTQRGSLITEVRYDAARAAMDPRSFEGFDKIDLSGASLTAGFLVRF